MREIPTSNSTGSASQIYSQPHTQLPGLEFDKPLIEANSQVWITFFFFNLCLLIFFSSMLIEWISGLLVNLVCLCFWVLNLIGFCNCVGFGIMFYVYVCDWFGLCLNWMNEWVWFCLFIWIYIRIWTSVEFGFRNCAMCVYWLTCIKIEWIWVSLACLFIWISIWIWNSVGFGFRNFAFCVCVCIGWLVSNLNDWMNEWVSLFVYLFEYEYEYGIVQGFNFGVMFCVRVLVELYQNWMYDWVNFLCLFNYMNLDVNFGMV